MARTVNLKTVLHGSEEAPPAGESTNDAGSDAAAAVADVDQEQATPAAAPAALPQKAGRSAGAQPARPARGGGQKAGQARKADPPPAAVEIEVLATDTRSGKKVTVYFHPDDYRELSLAKVDDGADFNARLRSMVALWRHDQRFRNKVNKLAQTAPRGAMQS